MDDVKAAVRPALYDGDFYAWTQDQAERLRTARPNSLDWENLAEEIDSLGRNDRDAIASNLNVILVHLLKWAYQPAKRKSGWHASIIEHRDWIDRKVEASPSLRSHPVETLGREYGRARRKAAIQTGLPLDAFPDTCPFTVEQVLAPDFLPGAA